MIEFRVLGPVDAAVDGAPVALPAAKPRALLAVLLLSRNRTVPVGELVDELWGDRPPETATKALQVYVSQLRKAIGSDRVLTKPPGYSVRVDDGELDLDRFEELVREGRRLLGEGDAQEAATALEQALGLWRGPALAEFRSEPFARDAGARLEEARLEALEERIDADLALGRHARLVPELEQLVARHPLRERPRGQLMLALYRSGRQAEALELYRRTRETLVGELGIEPSPELQELERAILRQDPALLPDRRAGEPAAAAGGPPAAAPVRRRRRRLLGVALGAAIVAAVAAGAAALAVSRDGSGPSSSQGGDLRAFVGKVENFLTQSRQGRQAVASVVRDAYDCKLAPRAAAAALDGVQRNRQSLLQQVAALSVPDDARALRASDLLQKSLQASISADWHYGDWLLGRSRCGPPDRSPDLLAARSADASATRMKRRFLVVFDPLAKQFGRRTWTAGEF